MEQNQQQQQKFQCTGDCLNCRMNAIERKTQWQYCSAQFTYNTMRMMETMQGALSAMQGTVDELMAKVDAIQDSEAMVFAPDDEVNSEIPNNHISQDGDGEEE